jgi:hypothetical protein
MNDPRKTPDALTEIELRVARRADELARERETHTPLDLDCWLLAEAEVMRTFSAIVEPRAG